MAAKRSEKERLRQLRRAEGTAAQQRAGRRERRIYVGLGTSLVVLGPMTTVIVSSSGRSTPPIVPAASTQVAASVAPFAARDR
jgi:hypothetical protein